ncbi:hypothetical protein [Sphingomonas fennica]|uniref:Glycosyltransferase RgtA/B/C/D-like domain-containing protein n=1 Tax=Edaphosphingomonas fennica TaxID=114404 RepID=A0A2T4HT87_9SPHN|nr:hypothetical protein [Sphingomonas fennica]PTD19002.1 hypothetical protein CV103_14195 [Sphingomonas fennica]
MLKQRGPIDRAVAGGPFGTLPPRPGFHWADGISLLLIALFAAVVCRFAFVQDIWIDETTQLSGSGLPFLKMVHWLLGTPKALFVVPDDRMPLGSYALDWLGVHLFALSPLGLRLLHGALLVLGLVVMAAALRRRFGPGCTAIALAILCLNPQIAMTAPEIRAYPLYLALACAMIAPFLAIVDPAWNRGWRAPIAVALLCAATVHVHFFGAVMSACVFVVLIARHIGDRRALIVLAVSGALGAALSVAVLPFIVAASGQVDHAAGGGSIATYAIYVSRLFVGSIHMVYPVAASLLLAGLVLAGAAALWRLAAGGMEPARRGAFLSLVAVVLLGLAITIGADIALDTLNAIKPTYSYWMMPFAAAAIAVGLSGMGLPARRPLALLSRGAVAAIVAGGLIATGLLWRHAPLFAHGPGQMFAEAIGKDSAATLIFEPGDPLGYAALPTRWRFHDDVAIWQAEPPAGDRLIRFATGSPLFGATAPAAAVIDAGAPAILVGRVAAGSYRDVRAAIDGHPRHLEAGPIAGRLAADPRWELVEERESQGLFIARIWRFRARPATK